MQTRFRDLFTTIRTEGALLPQDLLQRIVDKDSSLEGLKPEDYHLSPGERTNEVISRSWNRLLGTWASFQTGLSKLPAQDNATSLTRERWLQVLFQELGYGRLLSAKAITIDNRTYPIAYLWQNTPIHLVGSRISLDTRTAGVAGASRTSPHSLVQEFLNHSDKQLWGIVSNGLSLRILRDNLSITRQSYVEFDLEAIMEGQVYSDFALLWLLCHQSRFEGERQEECWLEVWSKQAQEQGTRALDQLRSGVEDTIKALGRGFLAHPANGSLRGKLQTGQLANQDYYRQLLRLVYRLIFLFVAEERDLLLLPMNGERSAEILTARERYTKYYSAARLRKLAGRKRGSPHSDLFHGLILVMHKLYQGYPELALPALGSFLWSERAIPDLSECSLANGNLLDAIYALSYSRQNNVQRIIDYKNLGAEELGSIYESLLELHPQINLDAASFELNSAGGNERKTTGSYYTPTSLINSLLDSALEPTLDVAIKHKEPEKAILKLKVCDPACGSGHFLIAAAHRIAKRLATVRTGDLEPAPEPLRTALRDIIGHCIYGVDINEMAVELCKVSLWMEALEPGKPLSFLEHRIQCGNSLLGATPALINQGIPDDAFKPIEGDDKTVCQEYKRKNKKEREGLQSLFSPTGSDWSRGKEIPSCFLQLDQMEDDSLEGVQNKEDSYSECLKSEGFQYSRQLADAWCAAFVWKKTKEFSYHITQEIFLRIKDNPSKIPEWMRNEINRLAKQYQFFHWHLAFPDVFLVPGIDEVTENLQSGWNGGFNVVLGNPPWERVKLQEKEWFASRVPEIANAPNTSVRKRMIEHLEKEDPALYTAFLEDRRKAEGESHFIRLSGHYPLCGRGDVNTYTIFAESMRIVIGAKGKVGCIVPSGIATDDTTKYYFQDIMDQKSLFSLYDFENRKGIFPAVDSRMKFCLLTLTGIGDPATGGAEFVFFAHKVDDLKDEDSRFTLSAEDIELLNPNTRTCPIFRSKRDAELCKGIYRRVPILIKEGPPEENPWGIKFSTMFHMSNDSHLFRTQEQLETEGWQLEGSIFRKKEEVYLPMYEAKMLHQYDHRWATYSGTELSTFSPELKTDAQSESFSKYWVDIHDVEHHLDRKWNRKWLIAFRRVCRSTDERSGIFTILPNVGAGDSIFLITSSEVNPKEEINVLLPNLNSFVFDYVTRQKVGGINFNFFIIEQLPVLMPEIFQEKPVWSEKKLYEWILVRNLELVYSSWELEQFATDIGFLGSPFRWDEERRFKIRCELDAAFFHLYGIIRDDVDYIMETFPIVKRKDEVSYGSYRTKELILEIFDQIQLSIETGIPYISIIDPLPGDPSCAHSPR